MRMRAMCENHKNCTSEQAKPGHYAQARVCKRKKCVPICVYMRVKHACLSCGGKCIHAHECIYVRRRARRVGERHAQMQMRIMRGGGVRVWVRYVMCPPRPARCVRASVLAPYARTLLRDATARSHVVRIPTPAIRELSRGRHMARERAHLSCTFVAHATAHALAYAHMNVLAHGCACTTPMRRPASGYGCA